MKPWFIACLGVVAVGMVVLAGATPVPAQAETMDLSAPEAQRLAAAGEVTLIDIRTPDEWRQTGVPVGAKRVNLYHPDGPQGFVAAILQQVGGDRTAPIALICRTGNRSSQAQRLLQEQDFTRVFNVREGMAGSGAGPGWIKRGLAVEP